MKDPSAHHELAAQIAALDEMSEGKGVTVGQLETYAQAYGADPTTNGHMDQEYGWYLSRVEAQNHSLFANGTPDYNAVAQGNIGDCFLLSAVSGQARLHPDRVVSMISPQNGGSSYVVRFPGLADPVDVSAPTDAQMARYGTSGADGTWASVLEKAYAVSRAGPDPEDPYAALAQGGTVEGLQCMTGDRVATARLDGSAHRAFGPFHGDKVDDDRQTVQEALANGQLATVSTDGAAAGVTNDHMLTLEGYDPSTDCVTVRNPWGWEPGSDSVTDLGHGEFCLKFDEFDKTFHYVNYQVASPPS